MNDQQKQKFLIDFNQRKIKGIENLSEWENKEIILEELKEEIKPENIVESTKRFFEDGT